MLAESLFRLTGDRWQMGGVVLFWPSDIEHPSLHAAVQQKYIRGWVLDQTFCSSYPSRNIYRGEKVQNLASIVDPSHLWCVLEALMIVLCTSQIWCSSIYSTPRNRTAKEQLSTASPARRTALSNYTRPWGILCRWTNRLEFASSRAQRWDWEHFPAVTEDTAFQTILVCSAH